MSLNKRLISGEAPAPGPAGFRALGFTGNGGAQTVTGMGFHPDIVWIKDRDTAYQHNGYFNSGGTGAAGWALEFSGTSSKYSLSGLTGFNSDGFVLGNNAGNNQGSSPNIAYGWKVSDTVDDFNTNTTGTIDASYQLVSDTRGMSTFVYTGSGSDATVGHGLSSAPEVVLIKTSSHTSNWPVYHKDLTNASYRLVFDENLAENTDNNPWNSTAPSSSVISIKGDAGNVNASGRSFICWAMHSVDKFSKFGSYTGNGSNDHAITGLGFSPNFLIIKDTDSTEQWYMFDTTRGASKFLHCNINNAEGTDSTTRLKSFDSDGFTLGTDGSVNSNNNKYIYMAWSDNGD